jgi:HD-GYP domain-containing protein (c-di-GMP phosphodiesterase class II)
MTSILQHIDWLHGRVADAVRAHLRQLVAVVGFLPHKQPLATVTADAVLQHHERLDGSGYPSGLEGDEIGEFARIIAVADVVEAMSSNRPYRPVIGIEPALEEIERGRGVRFDERAADACVELFRDDGFALTE